MSSTAVVDTDELARCVATEVMDWTLLEGPGGNDYWKQPDHTHQIPVVLWHPETSLDDAARVVERLHRIMGGAAVKKFYGFSITPWTVTIYSGNSDERWEWSDDTEQLAVCRAALLAVRSYRETRSRA